MDKQAWNPFFPNIQLSEDEEYYLKNLATKRPRFTSYTANEDVDTDSKRAALKVSSSVVSLESFSDEETLSQGCGTVIEVDENNIFVITSASLVWRPTDEEVAENVLADKLRVVVRTPDENTFVGEIYAYDFHYNLLVIVFQSNSLIEAAKLRSIDLHENIFEEKPFQLRPHSVKVKPGDSVIVVGRYFYKPYVFMAAPGSFSAERLPFYECKELLQARCFITRCGDGAPLINQSGDVIGIAFYSIGEFPILPINIPIKWWNHYKKYKELRHPSYGFEATDLGHSAGVATLEKVMRKFPSVSSGVVVEKVLQGSHAQSAGLSQDDVIIKCDGKIVKSFLELWELMFDKVGESVEFEVARVDLCSIVSLRMLVTEATTEELYKFEENEVGVVLLMENITLTLCGLFVRTRVAAPGKRICFASET